MVVGAGPAGLAAAERLARQGVEGVLVVERDDAPGGLPRFCGHLGFGWSYTRRLESGPAFAARMVARAEDAGVRILCRTAVLGLEPGPVLRIVGPESGPARLQSRAVVLAAGIRERPRGARLVPGLRPERGIYTTGLLQQMAARGVPVPGRRLVVVGTEHVAFSALLTARRLGLRVVAMVEPGERVLSHPAAGWLARRLLGIPVLTQSRIADIEGGSVVGAVAVDGPAGRRRIACEGVVFSGDWVPDATVAREAGLEWDAATGGPAIDQAMRTSLPGVFAAGNLLRGVETSGIAAREGARAGAFAAAWLAGALAGWQRGVRIRLAPEFRYLVPQRWSDGLSEPGGGAPPLAPALRMKADHGPGRVLLRDGSLLWQGPVGPHLRERRIRLDLTPLVRRASSGTPEVSFAAE